MIYFENRITSTVLGKAMKDVTCEHCCGIYHYEYRVVGSGQGRSAYGLDDEGAVTRATKSAARSVQARLRGGFAPVACPACGWIQADMVADLRRRFRQRSQMLGWVVPSLLAGLGIGVVLLVTNFFEQPLPAQSKPPLVVIGGAAVALFLFVGVRTSLASLWLGPQYHGTVKVPVGKPGPAPVGPVIASQEVIGLKSNRQSMG